MLCRGSCEAYWSENLKLAWTEAGMDIQRQKAVVFKVLRLHLNKEALCVGLCATHTLKHLFRAMRFYMSVCLQRYGQRVGNRLRRETGSSTMRIHGEFKSQRRSEERELQTKSMVFREILPNASGEDIMLRCLRLEHTCVSIVLGHASKLYRPLKTTGMSGMRWCILRICL